MEDKAARNITLDYYKFFLSFWVVVIHMGPMFDSDIASWFASESIARIAVPSFFVINGFYFANKVSNKREILGYLKHLLIIYTVWAIIYLKYYISADAVIFYYIMGFFHLWYVPALIFGIIMLVLLKKIIKKDYVLLIIAILLYIIGYIMEFEATSLYEIRNGLFYGYPLITIGYCCRSMKLDKSIKSSYLVVLLLVGLVGLFVESYITYIMTAQSRDLYLSLLICSPSAILLMIKYPKYKTGEFYTTYLSHLGSAIYFCHFLVIREFTFFADKETIFRFPFVFLLTVILSVIIITINKRIKIFL